MTSSGGAGSLVYKYGVLVYSLGTLNTGNNSHGLVNNLAVYWPTLASTTNANPFISSYPSCYVAYDYDYTQCSYEIMHNTSNYHNHRDGNITTKNITFASGNVNTTASNIVVTIIPMSLVFPVPNNDYGSSLETVFTSDVWSNEYYGALDGSNTANIGVTSTTRKQTATINFSTNPNVYVGNSSFIVTLTADNADFGVIETLPYAINDCVSYPVLSTCPTTIYVYEDNSTNPRIRFSVNTPFALPLYVYATTDSSNDGLYVAAAQLLTYRDYADCGTYLSYADYINTSTNTGHVQVWNAGACRVYEHVHYGENSQYYQTGAQTDFQFYVLPTGSDYAPVFTSDLISIVNETTDYLYPLVSLDSNGISSGYSDSTTLYDSGDAQTGTYNVGSTPTVSYTLTYYVQMLTVTTSGDHNLLITGTTSGFTYAFSGTGITDNGNGTANLVYTGTDTGLKAITMTVTTSNSLGMYNFGANNSEDIQFTVVDQAYLEGYSGPLSGQTQTVDTFFNFPIVVSLSVDDTNFYTSGTINKSFNKGNTYYIYLSSCGTVTDDLFYTITLSYGTVDINYVSSTYDASISGYQTPVSNPSYIVGCIRSGNSVSNIKLEFPQDHIISGSDAGVYTFSPDAILVGGTPVTLSSQVSQIYFNDSSSVHQLTFNYGVGGEIGTSSITIRGVDGSNDDVTIQRPNYYTSPSITRNYPTNVDLFINLGVQTNSIPYNIMNGSYDNVVINYNFYGSNTSIDDFTTQLTPGSTIFVYNNSSYIGTNAINSMLINSYNYNGNNTLYIVQGSTQYAYIMIKYYASTTGAGNLTSCYDYYHLPTSSSPVLIAVYDFSAAQTGTIGARYVSIGNYRFASDGVGDALITFLGNVQSDSSQAVGSSYVLKLKSDTANDYILTSNVTPLDITPVSPYIVTVFNQSTSNGQSGNIVDLNYVCIVANEIPLPDGGGDGYDTLFTIANIGDNTKYPANTINTSITVTYAMTNGPYSKKGVCYATIPVVITTGGYIQIPRRLMFGWWGSENNGNENNVDWGWSPYNNTGTIFAFSVHYNNSYNANVSWCSIMEYTNSGNSGDFPVNVRWTGGSGRVSSGHGTNQVAPPQFTQNGIKNMNNGLYDMPVYNDANGIPKVFSSNNRVYRNGQQQPSVAGAQTVVPKKSSSNKQTVQNIITALKNNPDLAQQLKTLLGDVNSSVNP